MQRSALQRLSAPSTARITCSLPVALISLSAVSSAHRPRLVHHSSSLRSLSSPSLSLSPVFSACPSVALVSQCRVYSGRAEDGSVRLPSDESSEAFEVLSPSSPPSSPSPLLLTCEHSSRHMPEPYGLPAEDQHLEGTHWQSDLGAAELTRELSAALHCPALLSRVSRLVVDVNRPLQSETLMRPMADGRAVTLNVRLSPHHFEDRISRFYLPYHRRLHRLVQEWEPRLALSVHSFTPSYEGQQRKVEVGVLYRRQKDEPLAMKLLSLLRSAGFVSEINEPWSGLEGFMYTMDSLTTSHPTTAPILAPPFTTAVSSASTSTRLHTEGQGISNAAQRQPPSQPQSEPHSSSLLPAASISSSTASTAAVFPSLTLMVECRQDLLESAKWRARFVRVVQQLMHEVEQERHRTTS